MISRCSAALQQSGTTRQLGLATAARGSTIQYFPDRSMSHTSHNPSIAAIR